MMSEDEQRTLRLRIQGMTCDGCATHVREALGNADGVIRVDLPDWREPIAHVTVSPASDPNKLIRAVRKAGYDASLDETQPSAEKQVVSDDFTYDYDLVVIGSGGAGMAASIRAAELRYKVAIIERGTIGGTCVNIGCIPSKTLFRTATQVHHARFNPFDGVKIELVGIDWPKIRSQKDSLVSSLRQKKYVDVLASYSDKITLLSGMARLSSTGSIQLDDGTNITSRRIIIATGARPRVLSIPGIDSNDLLTSTSLMDLDRLPSSLIIIGGRTIALELGQIMSRFGVKVTIVQRSDTILPDHEPEIREGLTEILKAEGINIITGTTPISAEKTPTGVTLKVQTRDGIETLHAERILMAVGRVPNTDGLNLEANGVKLDEHGSVIVDHVLRTSNSRIYAAGDVTTLPKFVYVAAASGQQAAQNALSPDPQALDLSILPRVIFTDPQVATVGLTEAEAKHAGFESVVSVLPLEHVPRSITAHDTRGFIKVVVDSKSRKLLGVSILAAEAGEIIQSAALIIAMGQEYGFTVDKARTMLFPYLTQVEGLKLALLSLDLDVSQLSCCAG